MIAEVHCHSSEHSACSQVCAADLIRRANVLEIQALVLTDHHYCWSESELSETRKKAGVPETFVLLSGQEVSTADFGDVLLFGPHETVSKQEITLQELRAKFPEAAIIWAHPYRYKTNPTPERLKASSIDAVEIFNSNHSIARNIQALNDWHVHKFVATGGSDTHSLEITGVFPTIFDHPIHSVEELAREIRSGRCRPFYKEIPRSGTSRTRISEITIGPKHGQKHAAVVLKAFGDAAAWKGGERSYLLTQEITRQNFQNGVFRIPTPLASDPEHFSIIEERIKGRTLHDVLIEEDENHAHRYLRMAAQWLAHFHNLAMHITPAEEHSRTEPSRLHWYLRHFFFQKHPDRNRIEEIRETVWDLEKRLLASRPGRLVQGHGDYHLKNIYLGLDRSDRIEYVCAIDFHSSYQLPRAFDVGTFIAQHLNMFFDLPEIAQKAPADIFLHEYLSRAENLEEDFPLQVELFKARTCLSILYYLYKVGKHESENFRQIIGAAEKSIMRARLISFH